MIELMVVVVIAGVLASIAIPNYKKHANRSKQAEAKLALTSIYALEKAFYSEYGAYIPSTRAIGYSPSGGYTTLSACPTTTQNNHHYQIGWLTSGWSYNVTGYSGTTTTMYYHPSWQCNGNPNWTWNSGASLITQDASCPSDDPQVFLVSAKGDLNPSGPADNWTINQLKQLINTQLGL